MDEMALGGWNSPVEATGLAGGTDRPSHGLRHGTPGMRAVQLGGAARLGSWGADICLPTLGLGSTSPFDFLSLLGEVAM